MMRLDGIDKKSLKETPLTSVNIMPPYIIYARVGGIEVNHSPRKHGNARKEHGFWCEVLQYRESKTKEYCRRTYDIVCRKWKTVRPTVIRFCGVYANVRRMEQESEAEDEDYIQRAMIHYEIETGFP
nr:hypothetical protein [Tanacetum cinerariifolium]